MRLQRSPLGLAGVALGAAMALCGQAHAGMDRAGCTALKTEAFPRTTLTSADWVDAAPAEIRTDPTQAETVALPAHCLVRGTIEPHADKAGRPFGVGFELRLPQSWNGRLFFQGGGGLDGAVQPAYGLVNGGPPALARGFAVVSMDGGHEGMDASFASDQQARLDFAYAAIGKAAATAKAVVSAFYAAAPRRTYFVGCSNGGREAMIAAQRYPLEFDGVVAGDPGFNLSHAAVAEAWADQHFAAIAPPTAHGPPNLAQALTDADLKLVVRKLLDDCDALDGLRDGMINNAAACHFTPRTLICGSASGTDCLPRAKVEALEAVFAGPHDSGGRPLYASFPYDTGMAQPGWRIWMLGFDGAMPALNVALGAQALSLYFMTPQQPNRSPFALDVDHADRDVAQTAAINDATSTFLTSFADHGGKLLIYQGQSDPVFSAEDIRAWYGRLAQSDPAAATYARLFIAPGMTHCNGGMATDRFDTLAALQDWVENNVAPDAIVATGKALPGVSRPLCAYPAYARYRDGDPSKAESFVCTTQGRPQ